MTKKYITYIGMALLLAGCTSEDSLSDTLSGSEKTPLQLETSLSIQRDVTRAANDSFEDGDNLLVYIRHTTGGVKGSYTTVSADQAPMLVTFTASEPPVLYWDDFSNSSSANTDLRTAGHALQTYYGYCYNGGAPTTALEETTGKLVWTIGNQTKDLDVQHADLLWSAEQEAVAYKNAENELGKLVVPFTHAMSEVTVAVKTDNTFGESPLTATSLTLNSMNTVATVIAPSRDINSTTPGNITMFTDAYTSGNTRTYSAIVTPGTPLTVGAKLLDIVDVEGNNYTLTITENMLKATAWAKEGYDDNQTAIVTQPGVNYHLDVNISKTAITVVATLADWTDVSASGKGDIAFDNDIVNVTVEDAGDAFADGSSFRLYWKNASSTDDYALATTSTLNSSEWENAPIVYWPNGTDQFFFRALSGNTGTTVEQSKDVLWGTTAKHNNIEAGAAIAPRTGNVPLIFKHAMTKIAFDLQTTTGADKVDLEGATIAISNLYTSGTISIEDGTISVGTTRTEDAISGLTDDPPMIVVPQNIGNDAKLTVTLNDGKSTTYSLLLNTCEDADDKAITAWKSGKSYTYTITLKKEAIGFRALIKDWDDATGSGHATLEWD